MRSVLSISLPQKIKKEIQERAKKSKKTVSAYFIDIFELERSLISEKELLEIAIQAEKDYKTGKTKKLESLSDLIKK